MRPLEPKRPVLDLAPKLRVVLVPFSWSPEFGWDWLPVPEVATKTALGEPTWSMGMSDAKHTQLLALAVVQLAREAEIIPAPEREPAVPAPKITDFKECASCAVKLGAAVLCAACLHNRALVGAMRERISELETRPPCPDCRGSEHRDPTGWVDASGTVHRRTCPRKTATGSGVRT